MLFPGTRFMSRILLATLLAASPVIARAADQPAPGVVTLVGDRLVECVAGDLPVVVTVPHGGRLTPEGYARREKGVRDMDVNTQELGRAFAAELTRRTGGHAGMVISLLHRSRLDPTVRSSRRPAVTPPPRPFGARSTGRSNRRWPPPWRGMVSRS